MVTTTLAAALAALCCAVPASAQTVKNPAAHATGAGPAPGTYVAVLEGAYAVPPVETQANGTAELTWNGRQLHYRLTVRDIREVTGAFVHIGPARQDSPAVADLFDGYNAGPVSGVLGEGTLTRSHVHGTTMARLIRALQTDNAYVTVHTAMHPDGELRGQLRRQPTVARR